MSGDEEIGIPMAGREHEGWTRSGERNTHREIGELLLRVDELEDTLRVMEDHPEVGVYAQGGARNDARRRLEERIRSERAKIDALERRGAIRYDEIERVFLAE